LVELVQDHEVVAPRKFCDSLSQNFVCTSTVAGGNRHRRPRFRHFCDKLSQKLGLRVRLVKAPHVPDVASRKPLRSWKGSPQVARNLLDDRLAPTQALLLGDDGLADVPVQRNQFAIDEASRREACSGYTCFDAADEARVVRGDIGAAEHGFQV